MDKTVYDYVIIGGGPAGLATALALYKYGQDKPNILILEASDGTIEPIGESAIPHLLIPLAKLGLDKKFKQASHVQSGSNISIWGDETPGTKDFLHNPLGPAWRLNRLDFDQMLRDEVIQQGGEIRFHHRFKNAQKTDYGFELDIHCAEQVRQKIKASFVIDATGPRAFFAKSIGIQTNVKDQIFALARFSKVTKGSLAMQTWIEAVEDGWWYLAYLPNGRLVTMFVCEADTLSQYRENSYQGWHNSLSKTKMIAPLADQLELVDEGYQSYPIFSSMAEQQEGQNWMLVGGAASCFDPIVAHGLYNALSGAILAAQKLTHSKSKHADYSTYIQHKFDEYCDYRSYIYQMVDRFSEQPFWQNRQRT